MERSVDLLLSCLWREEGETKAERLRGRSEDEWREAAAAAEYHGVGPLLFSTVRDLAGTLGSPGDLLEEMRRKYYAAAARNMRLYHELRKVLELFGRERIPVILLKGAHLAEAVYGNIALRSMGDVDLLVRALSMGKLHHAMMGTGAVAIATAAAIPGTLVNLAAGGGERKAVRFGHPSGTLRVGAEARRVDGQWTITKAIMSRSARILMEGWVRVPGDAF